MQQMSIAELAQVVNRQKAFKKDFIARPWEGFELVPNAQELALDGFNELPMGAYAHGDLASFTDIPKPYYDRMLAKKPELLAANVNRWLEELKDKPRMIRTLEGRVRCIRSNKFRALDHCDLIEAVLPALYEHPGMKITGCNLTESKLYLKVILPKLEMEVRKGDVVQFGLSIANSEIGQGNIEACIFALRLICLNGMVVEDGQFKKSHVGGRVGDELAAEYFADETRKAADRAFFLKLRDTVNHLLTEAACMETIQRMRAAAGMRIEARPDRAVKEVGKKLGLNESEQDSVLNFLLRGGDMTQWGMLNAITAAAQEIEDYDRASELEKMGGKVLELEAQEWRKVAA
jgi:hypothetical protein